MKYKSFDEYYRNYTTKDLTEMAKGLDLQNYSRLNKKELVLAVMEKRWKKTATIIWRVY